MFKVLHTSDWHLGHTLYGHDRADEQLHMLGQIEAVIADEQPDAMVVSGDIFHTARPSAATQLMFTTAVVRMREAAPAMTIVITAGNHDSGAGLEVFSPVWNCIDVFTIGSLERDIDHGGMPSPDKHIIKVGDKGYIAALPYCNERMYADGIADSLLTCLESLNTSRLPVVAMAHTAITGCDSRGHEDATETVIGGIGCVDINLLGQGYDYLALGHIHRRQWVCNGKARYSGSPLGVSFDEAYRHSVSIITLGARGESPELRTVDIVPMRPLVTLPSSGFGTWNEVLAELKRFPDDIEAYIRLNVSVDTMLHPTASREAEEAVKEKRCRFCLINTRRNRLCEDSPMTTLTVAELQQKQPADILRLYLKGLGETLTETMLDMFNEAADEVNRDMRDDNPTPIS